jgi:hypothetical protein
LPEFDSYAEIVSDFIDTGREDAAADLAYYASLPTLKLAVENAALGKMYGKGRHPHYYRRRRSALAKFRRLLLVALSDIEAQRSFRDLHALVRAVGAPISDIGPLTSRGRSGGCSHARLRTAFAAIAGTSNELPRGASGAARINPDPSR